MNKKNVPFDYNFLNTADYVLNPDALFDYIKEQKIICSKCHNFKKVKFNRTEITIKCNCGVGIIYPRLEERGHSYLYRFVPKWEYEKSK